MVMALNSIIVILFIAAPWVGRAEAPNWEEACTKAGAAAYEACTQASNGATGTDIAQALVNSAAVGKGPQQHPGAIKATGQTQDQAGRLSAALKQCREYQTKCKEKCDEEEKDRLSHLKPKDPFEQAAKAQNVSRAAQMTCIVPLESLQSQLSKGLNDMKEANAEATKTKNSTPSGMPPMTPPQQGGGSGAGDQSKTPQQAEQSPQSPPNSRSSTPTPTTQATDDCSIDPTLEKCKAPLLQRCTQVYTSGTSDTRCDTFTANFCNTNASSTNSISTANTRPGEGLSGSGAGFCNLAASRDFCSNDAGARKDCMTCQHYRNATSTACLRDPRNCSHATNAVLAQDNCKASEPPINGPIATTGGTYVPGAVVGGSAGTTVTTASVQNPSGAVEAKTEGETRNGPPMDLTTGGGSGGASRSSSFSNTEDYPSDLFIPVRKASTRSRAPSSLEPSFIPEAIEDPGVALFQIGSKIYQNRCANNQLRCGN